MRKPILFFILICLFTVVHGQEISLSGARSLAKDFIYNNLKGCSFSAEASTLIFTKNNQEVCYGINYKGGGYILVSAYETGNNILAYAPKGYLDKANMPPSLRVWINMLTDYIYDTYAEGKGKFYNPSLLLIPGVKAAASVSPLCTTLWDQGCYYNEDCPSDAFGPCNHCVTGCVATAMAQIMKRWNYPLHGEGAHTYNHLLYGTLSADFGSTTYQWDQMPDSLSGQEPAVAQLMSHCGIAVEMDYSSTSSGSYISPNPFTQYFRYSLNASMKIMADYDLPSWIQLLKHELDEGRPVLYSGMPAPPLPTGHAWVCDGYDNNDYFHFNWGWSGISNGYFQMGSFVYYLSNQAVTGLMPVQHNDIRVKELLNPVSSSFTVPVPIRITLDNYDTVPHWNIPLHYQIDNGTVVSELVTDTIAALSEITFEFSQSANFAGQPGHLYTVRIYAAYPGDAYQGNDTLEAVVEDVVCSQADYHMGFEPGEPRTGWKIINNNQDAYTWYYNLQGGNSGPGCIYMIPGGPQGDDWLISKCISLESGKLYRLSFWYIATGSGQGQDCKVWLGNSDNIQDMNVLLVDLGNTSGNTYQLAQAWFTVPASGSYYLGWHYQGMPGSGCPVLDDIAVTELNATDAGIHQIISPTDGCDLQQEPVIFSLRNYCSAVLQNIPVGYTVNNGSIVSDMVPGPLLPGEIIDFNFTVPADLSAAGHYTVKIFINLPADTLNDNDTVSFSVFNHHSPDYPYSMGFESNEDFSEWIIENTNGDNYTWTCQLSGGHTGPRCMRYDYSSWIAANDWIFTKCLYMTAGNTYKLKFWEKIEDPAWPENLSVSIGTAPSSTAMNEPMLDLPGLLNVAWQSQQLYFTVVETGYYYLGWKCYSDALMFNIYLDDIYLEEYPSAVSELADEWNIHLYPNPGEGKYQLDCSGICPGKIDLEIYSAEGGRVFSETRACEASIFIDLGGLSDGIYFLKLKTKDRIQVKKLIKK